jgi:hypothetical protein
MGMTRKRAARPRQRATFEVDGPRPLGREAVGGEELGRRPFVEPELVRHEKLTQLTLVSDFGGGGGGGATFF